MKRNLILISVGVIVGAAIVIIVSYYAGVSYGPTRSVYSSPSVSNANSSSSVSLPKAIPIFHPSSVYATSKSLSGIYNVTFTSNDTSSSVDSFYQIQLSANGWAITNEASAKANIYTYNASGHGYFLVIAIWPQTNSSGSSFTLLIYP